MYDFYRIKGDCSAYWLDGECVIHGIVSRGRRIQLNRAGPAVPMFSVPPFSPLLVTEEGKELLLENKFRGLSFLEVDYANVVDIDWHTWEEDEEIPDDVCVLEFATVILDTAVHRPDLVLKMPPIFEVVTDFQIGPFQENWKVDLAGYQGQRIVNVISKDGSTRFPIVSQDGKDWFVENGEGWLRFLKLSQPPETQVVNAR